MPNSWLDQANIFFNAGDGGNGAVAFHREKYLEIGRSHV